MAALVQDSPIHFVPARCQTQKNKNVATHAGVAEVAAGRAIRS